MNERNLGTQYLVVLHFAHAKISKSGAPELPTPYHAKGKSPSGRIFPCRGLRQVSGSHLAVVSRRRYRDLELLPNDESRTSNCNARKEFRGHNT